MLMAVLEVSTIVPIKIKNFTTSLLRPVFDREEKVKVRRRKGRKEKKRKKKGKKEGKKREEREEKEEKEEEEKKKKGRKKYQSSNMQCTQK